MIPVGLGTVFIADEGEDSITQFVNTVSLDTVKGLR